MHDDERYARFLSALGFRATLGTASPGGLELTDLDGEPIRPAMCLHVDPRSLAEHVGGRDDVPVGDSHADDLDEPDLVDPDDAEAARLQTLLAQIEEAILVRGSGQDHLVLVDGAVRAVAADEVGALAR